MRRFAWKRHFHQLKYGQSRCFRCGHRFGRNEKKFFPWPPITGVEQVCAECKAKEREAAR